MSIFLAATATCDNCHVKQLYFDYAPPVWRLDHLGGPQKRITSCAAQQFLNEHFGIGATLRVFYAAHLAFGVVYVGILNESHCESYGIVWLGGWMDGVTSNRCLFMRHNFYWTDSCVVF